MKSLIVSALAILLFSCKKETSNNVMMTYHMTQCADPWMADGNYFNNKENALKVFLQGKNIDVISLSIVTDCSKRASCLACNCLGCDIATVEIAEKNVPDMEALKFVRK